MIEYFFKTAKDESFIPLISAKDAAGFIYSPAMSIRQAIKLSPVIFSIQSFDSARYFGL